MVLREEKTEAGKAGGRGDPWALPELKDNGPKWNELTPKQKFTRVLFGVLKFLLLLLLLYIFVCSLSLLSSAFRLLGGKSAGRIFQNSRLLSNPLAGLVMGILATVLVQSSSTSTSVVVAMVSSGILDVSQAIYIIMGANIGTSVTNTIVSVFHLGEREEFRRAFAAATVHDCFNWLCVLILLPLEWIISATAGVGYLVFLSEKIVSTMPEKQEKAKKYEFLKALTKPLTSKIIQLDKKVIQNIAKLNTSDPSSTLEGTLAKHMCKSKATGEEYKCKYLFNVGWSDALIGAVLLVVSLTVLSVCLVAIVKNLRSMLGGAVSRIIRKTVNADFPGPFKYLTGYFCILVGTVLTFLVQSSSIFTSTLTPLVAVGVLSLDRCFPLTLGSNIGTTGTAIIAAFASGNIKRSLQIALCHFFFNITGILIWYPIPQLRAVPLRLAKFLGSTTAHYRWFAFLYLLVMFLLLPALVFALSLLHALALLIPLAAFLLLIIFVLFINTLQKRKPEILPEALKSWDFLPEPLRSLEPYDRVISKAAGKLRCSCSCCRRRRTADSHPDIPLGRVNAQTYMY